MFLTRRYVLVDPQTIMFSFIFELSLHFLAQGVTMSVCLSVCPALSSIKVSQSSPFSLSQNSYLTSKDRRSPKYFVLLNKNGPAGRRPGKFKCLSVCVEISMRESEMLMCTWCLVYWCTHSVTRGQRGT